MLYPTPSIVGIFPVADITAGANSTGVDLRNYIGNVSFVLDAQSVAGTTPTLDVKLQSSADNSTGWADISGAAFTQVTTVSGVQSLVVAVDSVARYVRVVTALTGTNAEYLLSITANGYTQRQDLTQ